MRTALFWLALAFAQGGEDAGSAPRPQAPAVAPKSPIAGIPGFRSRSRVVLESAPEQVLALEAFYVFPDRVRWSLLPDGAAPTQRQLLFRLGGDSWSIAPGESASKPLSPESIDARATAMHMELRRVAMMWPDGLEWRGQGTERMASTVSCAFVATLDESGRPAAIHARAAPDSGEEQSKTSIALLDITWKQQGERWWPRSFRLVGYGEHEWLETVESVDTAVNALDDFFVPPDRRKDTAGAASSQPQVIALPPVVQSRRQLPEGTSWDEALSLAKRWSTEEAARMAERGAQLQEGFALELAVETALPIAVLLRLASPVEPLPEGWERIAQRSAVSARRTGAPPIGRSAVGRLAEHLPAGAVAETPYVRIAKRASGESTLQVVLPFRPPN